MFINSFVNKLRSTTYREKTEADFDAVWNDAMEVERVFDREKDIMLTTENILTGETIDIRREILTAYLQNDVGYLHCVGYLKPVYPYMPYHIDEEYMEQAQQIVDKVKETRDKWLGTIGCSDVYIFPTYEEYKLGEAYGECEHCHTIYPRALMTNEGTPSNDLICEACCDDVVSCDRCGDLMYTDENWCRYSDCDGEYYCDDCYCDRFIHCDDCGTEIYRDEARWIDDCVYCDHCYDRHYDDEEEYDEDNEEYVKSYGWKPSPQFKDKGEDDSMYYGFELEVSGSQRHAPEFLNFFEDSAWSHDHVYLKSDCSIIDGGFEIVTQPMTWKYIKEDFENKLKNSLDFLKKQGFKGHNKGGLHIHLSRRAIDTNTFMRMQSLLYNAENYDNWLVLTQRKADNIDQWARLTTDKSADTIRQYYEVGYNCVMGSTRYHGLNVTDKTVELRIFNSNLRIERVMKNLEIAKSLVEFSRTKCHCNFKRYIAWVHKNKATFPNLDAFIKEKGYSAESNTFGNMTEELVEA